MAKKLLMGNEAFAHAALEAGVRVVAGYPGTPSSELVETVAAEYAAGRAQGVHVEWSTNEKAALELLAGASYCGARALFTCKQVGLNVASDALMSLNYVGVKGGMVLFVADDPGPISSQTEQDTRRFAMFAKVPVLDPATPEQGFAMMKTAFDLSERYRTPVIVRPTTRIDHASTFFDVAEKTEAHPVPAEGFERGSQWVIFPKRAWEAHGEINERLQAMAHDFAVDAEFAVFNPVLENGAAPRLGIMAGGVSAAYAREALAILETRAAAVARVTEPSSAADATTGAVAASETDADACGGVAFSSEDVSCPPLPAYRFMQVGTPYPFPEEAVAQFVEGLDAILVLEELDHVLEDELLAFAGKTHATFDVLGKLTGHARDRGENDVDDVVSRIEAFFAEFTARPVAVGEPQPGAAGIGGSRFAAIDAEESGPVAAAAVPWVSSAERPAVSQPVGSVVSGSQDAVTTFEPPVRPPVLCAGCPHRGSFYAVKRALGKREAVLCGDIGCYTLGNAKPLDAVDTCLCMGAGITMAQGFAVAEPQKKQVAFVGDSTFFASGITGVANAVYNGHDITVAVLDNSTTAMTGGQPHPGTGITLMGQRRKPISIEAVLQALGVECIVHANPLDLEGSVAAARTAVDFAGPSAILFESPCVQLVRPGVPAVVDASACTGCKKCITEIGCPAVGFDSFAAGPKSGKRGQAFVDASLCNGCGLCTQLCPFDALVVLEDISGSPNKLAGKEGGAQ